MDTAIAKRILERIIPKFNWFKFNQDGLSKYDTLMKKLREECESYDMGLSDLANVSEAIASNITDDVFLETVNHGFEWEIPGELQDIEFWAHLADDGITTVILDSCFESGNIYEIMSIIQYLGAVRLYIDAKVWIEKLESFPELFFPNNIIHMEIHSDKIIGWMERDQTTFPKYLRSFIDNTHKYYNSNGKLRTYNSRLPPSVINLCTTCPDFTNLPPSLKILRYHDIRDFADIIHKDVKESYGGLMRMLEIIPVGIKRIIYCAGGQYIDSGVLETPPRLQYLAFKLGKINSESLTFRDVQELFIPMYNYAANQNVELIFGDDVQHLILPFGECINLLKSISEHGNGLKKLSIVVEESLMELNYNPELEFPKEYSGYSRNGFDQYLKYHTIIQEFHKRFPAIQINIVPSGTYEYNDNY